MPTQEQYILVKLRTVDGQSGDALAAAVEKTIVAASASHWPSFNRVQLVNVQHYPLTPEQESEANTPVVDGHERATAIAAGRNVRYDGRQQRASLFQFTDPVTGSTFHLGPLELSDEAMAKALLDLALKFQPVATEATQQPARP